MVIFVYDTVELQCEILQSYFSQAVYDYLSAYC